MGTKLFFRLQMCMTHYFVLWGSKLPTPWGSYLSSSNIIDWQFSCLSPFLVNGISLPSDEAEMKNLQRSRQAQFLGTSSPDSFSPDTLAHYHSHLRLKGEPAILGSKPRDTCSRCVFFTCGWDLSKVPAISFLILAQEDKGLQTVKYKG